MKAARGAGGDGGQRKAGDVLRRRESEAERRARGPGFAGDRAREVTRFGAEESPFCGLGRRSSWPGFLPFPFALYGSERELVTQQTGARPARPPWARPRRRRHGGAPPRHGAPLCNRVRKTNLQLFLPLAGAEGVGEEMRLLIRR